MAVRKRHEATWNSQLKSLLVSKLCSFLSKLSIPYFSSHSLNWCNKAYISDFEQLSYNTLTFAPILSVLFWNYGELANYNVTKSSSNNLPKFPQTIPFVKQREIAVFKVKYLSSILTKLWFRLDYDYFDKYRYLLF